MEEGNVKIIGWKEVMGWLAFILLMLIGVALVVCGAVLFHGGAKVPFIIVGVFILFGTLFVVCMMKSKSAQGMAA